MSVDGEHHEQNASLWQMTAPPFATAALAGDETADVCVMGGGIAGLSVAYELAREGRSVVVLEGSKIGAGMTGRTTAHIVNALDDRYYELERLLGLENARLAAASHTRAIERAAEIVREENIDCDFEQLDGYLFNPPGETEEELQKEYESIARIGISVDRVAGAPIPDFQTGPALRFRNQAQFHPIKYLAGLAAAIQRRGGRIYTDAHANGVEGNGPLRVRVAGGAAVTARSVVVATNTPVNDRYVIHTKQAPYTTYVIGLRVPAGAIPRALFWDTALEAGELRHSGPIAYHYVRLHTVEDHDVLIVGGEDHKTGQNDDFEAPFRALEEWARTRFPAAGAVEYRWSGQVMEPVDGMGFIGHNPADEKDVYVATGDSGNGITHGIIAGMLIRDLILGRNNPWSGLYDPSRITPKATRDFLHENLNVAAQFREYLTTGDVASVDQIPAGGGAIVREGLKKIAAYRDEHGELHRLSAICPHLKCIVRWNSAEHTWDCPCHGSRFDALGTVLTGPANRDLEPIEAEAHAPAGSA